MTAQRSAHFSTGLLFAAAGSIAFSGKAIIVKLAYRHGVDAVTLVMYRMLFALPMFLLMGWWAGRGQPRIAARDWLGIAGLGLSGYYLASFLDFWGLEYITASLERLILYLNPTLVLVLGWLLYRRRINHRQGVGMAISYAGVLLVFGHELSLDGTNAVLGSLLVLASAISYALYLSYSGQMVQRLGSLRHVGGLPAVHRAVCPAASHCIGCAGRARSDLVVGAQCHDLHRRAGGAGDDGHRTHWCRSDGADRHDRPHVHPADGGAHSGRAVQSVDRGGHRAGALRCVLGHETPQNLRRKTWIWALQANGRWSVAPAKGWAGVAHAHWPWKA
jgi:uncharacterized membrane protein